MQVGLDTLQGDSTLDSGPNIESGVQEDIKEVEIETEDPSHLFWVSTLVQLVFCLDYCYDAAYVYL